MKRILIIMVVIGVLIVAGVLFTVHRWKKDEPVPDDTDLQLDRPIIPAELNAFTYLEQTAGKVYWPDEKSEMIRNHIAEKIWRNKTIVPLLEKNKDVFELFDKAVACEHLQLPEVTDVSAYLPYFSRWRKITNLRLLSALNTYRGKEEAQAFEEVISVLRFGHLMEGSESVFTSYLVGTAIKEQALATFRRMIPRSTLSPGELVEHAEFLNAFRVDTGNLQDTFRAQYAFIVSSLNNILAGRFPLADLVPGIDGSRSPSQFALGLMVQKNKTRRLFIETFRKQLENAGRSYAAMDLFHQPVYRDPVNTMTSLLLTENGLGKVLHHESLSTINAVLTRKCRLNVSVAGTRIMIAMKAYEEKHGGLPQTLADLVPDFLLSIPPDDFDGLPFRYNPEKKIIYSIGEDLNDSQNNGGNEPSETDDIVYVIPL